MSHTIVLAWNIGVNVMVGKCTKLQPPHFVRLIADILYTHSIAGVSQSCLIHTYLTYRVYVSMYCLVMYSGIHLHKIWQMMGAL